MFKLRDIIKTENIIKVDPDETLSSALAKLTTSHDAAFIFSKDNKFLGVINPYFCFIKSSYPGNARVEHCAFHPPHVKIDYPLSKVVQLIIESKIHYLPVFDQQEKFLGIISARRILSQIRNSLIFNIKIGEILKEKNRPLITIYEDEVVSTAISAFKQTKVSKLVVINKDLKLKGILSYYDLIAYLASPRDSAHRGEREGNKTNFYNMKIRNFLKNYVLTLTANDLLSTALSMIIDKKIGSVVIVDESRHPTGIITTRDLLRFFTKRKSEKKSEITSKNITQESRQTLGGFFNNLTSQVLKKVKK